ncbi:MAG: glycosyltransferase family protein [Nitrosotalea sp.]
MFDGKYFDWNQKRIKSIVDYYGYKFFFGKKLADLGCGHADLSGVVYRLGAEITAIDARQEHLKVVTKKFPGVKTVKANLDGPWPFHGQAFDMIMDLGLICHLASFENHLKSVCASATYLVIETAVCDSDEDKCIQVPESKDVYDLSYNGMGCRPSAAAIERVLSFCHMSFKRMDKDTFNSGEYIYDWQVANTNNTSLNRRRIWFCTKNQPGVVLPESAGGQPAVVIQPPVDASFYQQFHRSGVPTILTAAPRPPAMMTHPPHNPKLGPSSDYVDLNPESLNFQVMTNSKKYALVIPETPSKSDFVTLPKIETTKTPLKVLYLPIGSQTGTVEAWRQVGVELEIYDFHGVWERTHSKAIVAQEFLHKVRKFQPHLIHMQLQFTGLINDHVIAEARASCPGVVITNWSGDVRAEAIASFANLGSVLDYTLISSTGQLQMYKQTGSPNVKYWQIGYDPKVNYPLNKTNFKYDVSFLANNYGHTFPDGGLRMSVATALRAAFGSRFGLFGSGYSPPAPRVNPEEAIGVYNDSVCALSISNFNNVSHYFSDRLLHCMASGRPTISWHFPGYESYFTDRQDIFIAHSPQEIIDIVNYCKANPDMANQVGINGYQKVLKEHTFTSRVIELLHMTNLIRLL